MKTRFGNRQSIVAALIGSLVLAFVLLLPVNAASWSTPCNPLGGLTILVSDGVVAPDGFNYVVVADPNANITALKFKPGQCSATPVSHGPVNAQANTVLPKGPIEAFHPHIATSSYGDVVFTYRGGDSTNGYLAYYQRKPAGQAGFNPPILIGAGNVGGIALDTSGNVHAVWYNGSGGFYQRYDKSDKPLGSPITLTTKTDAEPKVTLDSADNAHVVWIEYTTPTTIRYNEFAAGVSLSGTKTIASLSGNALYPYLVVDSDNKIQVTFDGTTNVHQTFYVRCDSGGANCTSPKNVSQTAANSASPKIAVCGATPYISYYNADSGTKQVFVSANLGAGQLLSNGSYSSIFSGAGYLNLTFRDGNGRLAYTYLADSNCGGTAGPTPTPTASPTTCVNCPPAPIAVANTTGGVSTQSSIAMDSSNNAYITWVDNSVGAFDVLARIRNADGSYVPALGSFPTNLSHTTTNSVWPSMTSTGNGAAAIWMDNGPGYFALYWSQYISGTWSARKRVNLSTFSEYYPATAWTTDSRLWALYQQNNDIFAQPIGSASLRNVTASALSDTRARAAAGTNGKLFVVWQSVNSVGVNGIYFNSYNGTAWTARTSVKNVSAGVPGGETYPDIAAFGDTLYVVFMARGGTTQRNIWMNTSTDGGLTWGTPAVYGVSTGLAQNPRIAVDSTGTVHVVWADGGKIYYKKGTDAPVVISGSFTNAELPSVAVGPDNVANIIFDTSSQVYYYRAAP